MSGNSASLTIRNRSRLPEGRVVEVSVARLSVLRVALLILVLGGLAFLGGVAAGTGGYYRHAVDSVTRVFGSDSLVSTALLAPDRTTAPSLAKRLSLVEGQLQDISKGYAKERDLRESLISAFTEVAGRLGEIEYAIRSLDKSVHDTTEASARADKALRSLLTAIKKARERTVELVQSEERGESE